MDEKLREKIRQKLLSWDACCHINCEDRKCDSSCSDMNNMVDQILALIPQVIGEPMKEYLILVYPKGGGQPKEVWWLQDETELLERQSKLAEAREEFIIFDARVRLMFH